MGYNWLNSRLKMGPLTPYIWDLLHFTWDLPLTPYICDPLIALAIHQAHEGGIIKDHTFPLFLSPSLMIIFRLSYDYLMTIL